MKQENVGEAGTLGDVSACSNPASATAGEPDAGSSGAALTPTPTPTPTLSREGQQEEKQRTLVVRTPDSCSLLKVAVPSTTAEAMAMNASIKEKAKRNAELVVAAAQAPRPSAKFPSGGRAPAAAAAAAEGVASRVNAGRRGSTGGKKAAAASAAESERRPAPSVMMVKPDARSKAIQMKVPQTTAECIKLNEAIRERYPGGAPQEADNKVFANYSKRWRDPRSPAPGGGSDRGVLSGEAAGSKGVHGGAAGTVLSSPQVFGYTQPGDGSGEPSFERTIGDLNNSMRWQQIVRVWEVRARG